MAPTFLGIAGLAKPSQFDGKSLMPLLTGNLDEIERDRLPQSVAKHLSDLGSWEEYINGWRDQAYIEYYYVEPNVKCCGACPPVGPGQGYPEHDSDCGDLTPDHNDHCWAGKCSKDCYPTESNANNFRAVRGMPGSSVGDVLYAEYQTGNQINTDINFSAVDFVELFDVGGGDIWLMNNLANKSSSLPVDQLKADVAKWYNCAGDACP